MNKEVIQVFINSVLDTLPDDAEILFIDYEFEDLVIRYYDSEKCIEETILV